MSDYEGITNEFFHFSIDSSHFEIHYGGDLINGSQSDYKENKITGTWKLGLTGHYIELQLSNGFKRLMTILAIEKERFQLRMSMPALDKEFVMMAPILELKILEGN